MEPNRYKYLWQISNFAEEYQRLEWQLMRKLDWINKPNSIKRFSRLIFDQTATDQFNNSFKTQTFWTDPKFIAKLVLKEKPDFEYPGEYEIPIQALLSEEFREFFQENAFKSIIEKFKKEGASNSKQKLLNIESELRTNLLQLHHERFQPTMKELSEYFTWYIQKNSTDVAEYAPHEPTTENGRDTEIRYELIVRAETAYYGVYCGNVFAYEWIACDFVTQKTAYILDDLWELQKKILEVSKEYVSVQMMIKHFKFKRGDKYISDEILIKSVEKCISMREGFVPEPLNKTKTFLSKKGKIQPTPISEYLHYVELAGRYSDPKQIYNRINKVLSEVKGIEKVQNSYFKK